MPDLSLCHLSLLELAPSELIAVASKTGYSSVGLRTRPAAPGGAQYPLAVGSTYERELRQRLADTGLTVLCVETVPINGNMQVSDFDGMLEEGASVGAKAVVAAGDDDDLSAVSEKLDELCERAARFGLIVELEFMPFRPVRSLAEASDVLNRVNATNCKILVDALHFTRSRSSIEALASLPKDRVGTFHFCDGPKNAPAELAHEARKQRLAPGAGEFALREMVAALPPDIEYAVEVPIESAPFDRTPIEHARILHETTFPFLR